MRCTCTGQVDRSAKRHQRCDRSTKAHNFRITPGLKTRDFRRCLVDERRTQLSLEVRKRSAAWVLFVLEEHGRRADRRFLHPSSTDCCAVSYLHGMSHHLIVFDWVGSMRDSGREIGVTHKAILERIRSSVKCIFAHANMWRIHISRFTWQRQNLTSSTTTALGGVHDTIA